MRFGCAFALGQVRRGIGHVHLDPFHQGAEGRNGRTLAAFCHLRDDFGGQLQVPGIVEFAGFQNRTTGRGRVTATFQRGRGKGGLCRVTVVGVGFQRDHVVRTEIGDHEGAGADRGKVRLGALGGLGTQAIGELCRLDDRGLAAHERLVGVRLGFSKVDHDGQVVRRLDRGDAFELGQLRATAFGMHAVFRGKGHVGRGHGRAVGPQQAFLQFPGDLFQILGHATVFDGRDFLGQVGHHVAVLVEPAKRFDDHRGRFDVLRPRGQIGRHDRGRLPIDDIDVAVGTAFGHGHGGHAGYGNCAKQQGFEFHFPLHCWIGGSGSDAEVAPARRMRDREHVKRAQTCAPKCPH